MSSLEPSVQEALTARTRGPARQQAVLDSLTAAIARVEAELQELGLSSRDRVAVSVATLSGAGLELTNCSAHVPWQLMSKPSPTCLLSLVLPMLLLLAAPFSSSRVPAGFPDLPTPHPDSCWQALGGCIA